MAYSNRFSGLCHTWQKRHWLLREREGMRDRKLVGSRQRSLSSCFILPRHERPLLAGNRASYRGLLFEAEFYYIYRNWSVFYKYLHNRKNFGFLLLSVAKQTCMYQAIFFSLSVKCYFSVKGLHKTHQCQVKYVFIWGKLAIDNKSVKRVSNCVVL